MSPDDAVPVRSATPQEAPPRTLVQFAAEQLRAKILSGELAPERPIRIGKLADEFGISPIPMREALQLLSAEGMVVSLPRRGYTVATLEIDDLDDTYLLRMILEPLAIRLSVPRLTENDLELIRHELKLIEGGGQIARDHHRAAHFLFYGRCDSVWLMRCIDMLWQNAQRYQQLMERIDGEFGRRLDEHWSILEAAEAGDSELASRLVEAHLDNAGKKIREYLQSTIEPT